MTAVTATCPLACFRPESAQRSGARVRTFARGWLLALALGLSPALAVERLSLKIADVANPVFALHDIQAVFDAGGATAYSFTVTCVFANMM